MEYWSNGSGTQRSIIPLLHYANLHQPTGGNHGT